MRLKNSENNGSFGDLLLQRWRSQCCLLGRVVASISWGVEGVLLVDHPENYYRDILHWSSEATTTPNQRKRRGKLVRVVLFRQDNASTHKSKVAMTTTHSCGLQLLEHLPYSLDVDPMTTTSSADLIKSSVVPKLPRMMTLLLPWITFWGHKILRLLPRGNGTLHHLWSKCVQLQRDFVENELTQTSYK